MLMRFPESMPNSCKIIGDLTKSRSSLNSGTWHVQRMVSELLHSIVQSKWVHAASVVAPVCTLAPGMVSSWHVDMAEPAQERLLLPDKEWTSVLALGMSNWLTNKLAKLQGSSLFITLVVEHYAPALTADQLATLEKIFEQVPKKLQTLHATRFSFDKRWRLISAQGQTLPMFWMTHDCVAGFPFEGFDGLDTNSSLPLEVLISRQ